MKPLDRAKTAFAMGNRRGVEASCRYFRDDPESAEALLLQGYLYISGASISRTRH